MIFYLRYICVQQAGMVVNDAHASVCVVGPCDGHGSLDRPENPEARVLLMCE